MAFPELSVIMTNYNHGQYLSEQLTAILSQSKFIKEIIIIDDASTDNSVELIDKFSKKFPIIRSFINERNLGVLENTNRLFELCSGEYVFGAGADDIVLPGLFERSMRLLIKYPQAGFCSAGGYLINEKGKKIKAIKVYKPGIDFVSPEEFAAALRQGNRYVLDFGSSRIYRKEALLELGGLPKELFKLSDVLSDYAIGLKYGACYIDDYLSCSRITGYNFSGKKIGWNKEAEMFATALDWMKSPPNKVIFPSEFITFFYNRYYSYCRQRAMLEEIIRSDDKFRERIKQADDEITIWKKQIFGLMGLIIRIYKVLWIIYLKLRSGQRPFRRWGLVT
jgi:glycosyltransferase involved in cell wall biosynthesis